MRKSEHAQALAEQMLAAEELALSRSDLDIAAEALLALAKALHKKRKRRAKRARTPIR